MKVLFYGGGLGNQIFEQVFYLYLKECGTSRIYGVYNKKKLSEHYGLEIQKWFDVQLPPTSVIADMACGLMLFMKKVFGLTKYVDLDARRYVNKNAIVIRALKYTKLYFPKNVSEVIRFNIDDTTLSLKNQDALQSIRTTNSFFIHVRRGDYLSPQYKAMFEGTCPIEYYRKAIADVIATEQDPMFYVFSDDMKWAKGNIQLPNVKYIDWNTGESSPIDMYLMSNCKGAIIANSTFSYWGALLGRKKRVFYPKRWINSKHGTPDIFMVDWQSY